jgi:hypothetical protein
VNNHVKNFAMCCSYRCTSWFTLSAGSRLNKFDSGLRLDRIEAMEELEWLKWIDPTGTATARLDRRVMFRPAKRSGYSLGIKNCS